MSQAIQIMLMTALISVGIGFLVSFMIWILTLLLNLGRKEEVAEGNEDMETALAIAATIAALNSNRKQ